MYSQQERYLQGAENWFLEGKKTKQNKTKQKTSLILHIKYKCIYTYV
jgi:hypothetical protein